MGAGIAASPHCAERRICRCSRLVRPKPFLPSILAHQLRRRFPSTALSPLTRRSLADLLGCAASPLASLSTVPAGPKALPPMVCGPSWDDLSSRSASLSAPPKRRFEPRPEEEEDHLFRRLFPAWPRIEPESSLHCLPAEIGALAACRPREAGTAVPIT